MTNIILLQQAKEQREFNNLNIKKYNMILLDENSSFLEKEDATSQLKIFCNFQKYILDDIEQLEQKIKKE